MLNKKITQAITALLAIGAVQLAHANQNISQTPSAQPMAKQENLEKCYGIVKAGLNDCGNSLHTCAGETKVNADPHEWIYLPTGLCTKISGGSLKE